MPHGTSASAGELYASATTGDIDLLFDPKVGWLYMRYFPTAGAAKLPEQETPTPAKVANAGDGLETCAYGSGFIVHPHYIITNRHVVEHSDGLLVSLESDSKRTYPATVVQISEEPGPDLAVIRCDSLSAPPLRLCAMAPTVEQRL